MTPLWVVLGIIAALLVLWIIGEFIEAPLMPPDESNLDRMDKR